ncbi:hypothetical protein [Paracoccus pantotrophus]|nr:hypothetical protein [Paracoccus pantotrophus]MDF3856356.1 hypothetical protein [Paracoccus pantotrophus]
MFAGRIADRFGFAAAILAVATVGFLSETLVALLMRKNRDRLSRISRDTG